MDRAIIERGLGVLLLLLLLPYCNDCQNLTQTIAPSIL